jgi:hypothetical protein
VRTARGGDAVELQEACREVWARATGELDGYQAIRNGRYLRPWTDPDGAFRMNIRMTPDDGAGVMACLEPHRHRIFESATSRQNRSAHRAAASLGQRSVGRARGERSP